MFRVVQLECEADDGRDGRERDVALVEVEAQAEHFAALVDALADDARVGNRRCVRARARRGQRKAGDVLAAREARQVMVLLFLGAVMQQQLGRPERIRHGDRRGDRRAATREFHEHARMRVRREFEAAVPLRDDHREEALLLQEVPDLRWHVGAPMRDVPVIDHAAQFFARAVDERLLFGRELRRLRGEQLVPVGMAREQSRRPTRPCRPRALRARCRDIDGSMRRYVCRNGFVR